MSETLDLDLTDEDLPVTRAYRKEKLTLGERVFDVSCPPDHVWIRFFEALSGEGFPYARSLDLIDLALSEADAALVKRLATSRAPEITAKDFYAGAMELSALWGNDKAQELREIGVNIPEAAQKRIEKILLKKKASKAR